MRKLTILTLAVAMSLFAAGRAPAREKEDLSADELRLQSLGLSTDGADLLDFFRKRSLAQVPTATLDELIKGLGSKDAEVRKKAMRDLIGYGALAVPTLRVALSDPDDTLVYEGARRCLRVLTGEEAPRVAASAARVLAAARPRGAIEVLMGYLLNADNEDVTEAVKSSLTMLAFAGGKADPVLIKALEDPSPLKRAVAIDVLCSSGQAEPRATLRKLLADPKPSVRLRAALALARVKDAKAVSTLIVLLPEAPFKIARQAEEFLNELAGDQAPKIALAEEGSNAVKVREAWAEWWLKSEAPGLLDELKKRTMTDAARNEVVALIQNLGSDVFKVREAAEKKLKDKGVLVVPLLKQATKNDPDPEVRERAARCLVDIEKSQVGPLSPVIPRLVALRKPQGGGEALLNFLPFADDESLAQEVQAALNTVAYIDGKPDPVLIKALGDRMPARRAAAAEALAQVSDDKILPQVKNLLKDPSPLVRQQVALALARALADKEVVPVLINALGELTVEQASAGEDFLSRLAGDETPTGNFGSDQESRKKRSQDWANWWKSRGDRVDLVALRNNDTREPYYGYTLVISQNWNKIQEITKDGKPRWEITNLSSPSDAHVLGNNRILVLEANTRRISERNTRGDVLWSQTLNNIYWPTACQRLPNGNTFIVSSNKLIEINRAGTEVWSFNRPNGDIYMAKKMPDGQVVIVTSSAICLRIDKDGKQIKSWNIPYPSNYGIDILKNGNVLFPQQYNNRVYEHTDTGQQVWTATVTRPQAVKRLNNGNTLVASYSPYEIREIDRSGKEVWKVTLPIQATRVYRR